MDFIVMEYVRGESMSALLSHGRLPVSQSLDYAIQICEALKTAHGAGVVHRDLKPGNIMIAPSGLVKVLDFGIAKRVSKHDAAAPDTTALGPLTLVGVTMGTPAYMSPEQALGDPVDARSDLFSLGVVLYQMVSGVLPFQGATSLSLLRQIVHERPQPLRVVAPDVPEGLAAVVEKCLAKEPADRYPSAAAVGEELRRVEAGDDGPCDRCDYYKQGRYEEALKAYETVRELAPDYTRAYSFLAAVYHQLGRTDEAAAVLQRSLEIAPDNTTYSNLGTLLYFQGRYPEALSAFERGVQLGANTYLRWGNLADAARMVAGGHEKAHESYTRAVQLAREHLAENADDADARSSLALYLIRDERRQEALVELDRVLAQKNLIPGVLFKVAIVAELAGQRARALELLGRTLAAGYQLREIIHEPDLVKLRTDPEYHKLVSRYEK